MTRRDEVTRMARESGMCDGWSLDEAKLGRFAAMVASSQRERCAKAVAAEALEAPTDSEGDIAYDRAISHAVAAIRALKDGEE